MQVKVGKYLNARIGKASTDALCIDFKVPGDTIDISEVLIGTEIHGSAIWYKNKTDGCYYWSEGVSDNAFLLDGVSIYAGLSVEDQHTFLRSYIYCFFSIRTNQSKVSNMAVVVSAGIITLSIETTDGLLPPEVVLTNGKLIFKGADLPFTVSKPTLFRRNMYVDTQTPFVLGGSVSNQQTGETGTRGIYVKRDGQSYLLTCYHVACDNLVQNAITEFDGTDIPVMIPSALSDSTTVTTFNGKVSEGVLNRYFDYAAITVSVNFGINLIPKGRFINASYRRADYNKLTIGMLLNTFGSMTNRAVSGKITKINYGPVPIDYGPVGKIEMIETIETEEMSQPGDSGAPVFDGNAILVGLIIGNNPETQRSLIMPVHQLFFNKNFSI